MKINENYDMGIKNTVGIYISSVFRKKKIKCRHK